jgi:hypothetical protein
LGRAIWKAWGHSVPEKIATWLNELRQCADALALSLPSGGQPLIQLEHLKKALQAVVYQYIAEVQVVKRLTVAIGWVPCQREQRWIKFTISDNLIQRLIGDKRALPGDS